MRRIRRFLGLAALLVALPVAANELTVGKLTMHFSALPTTTLTPEVAREFGVTRSTSRALLNVAVLRNTDGLEPQAAEVTASATNLTGQRQEIPMREVREGDAIYYLGEFRIADRETMVFDIRAVVDGVPLQTSFQQQFFAGSP